MAHEKEKAQYKEDRNNHERPWELWENCQDGTNWTPCLCELAWNEWSKYRRIEPVFEPESFSGLNWREAVKKGLVGKVVEYSEDGENWKGPDYLFKINPTITSHRYVCGDDNHVYIRTTPQTYAHPTITISGVKLPRPEVEAPEKGTIYWIWKPGRITRQNWVNVGMDLVWLKEGRIHLTEDRAQAWADWWSETVIKAIKG